ncbi:MAG: 4Fe-4S binding protein [Mobilitalea sp.]
MKIKRIAVIDKMNCVACGACTKKCPRAAIQIYRGMYAIVDKTTCIGCGKCSKVCPADAIQMEVQE